STATDRPIAPEPAHRSTTTGAGWPASTDNPQPTRCSVSGRGTNTPGPTASTSRRNPALPRMRCSGSPPAPRGPRPREAAPGAGPDGRGQVAAVRAAQHRAQQRPGVVPRAAPPGPRQPPLPLSQQPPHVVTHQPHPAFDPLSTVPEPTTAARRPTHLGVPDG